MCLFLSRRWVITLGDRSKRILLWFLLKSILPEINIWIIGLSEADCLLQCERVHPQVTTGHAGFFFFFPRMLGPLASSEARSLVRGAMWCHLNLLNARQFMPCSSCPCWPPSHPKWNQSPSLGVWCLGAAMPRDHTPGAWAMGMRSLTVRKPEAQNEDI